MTREDLIKNWGPEVILKCCTSYPGHAYTVMGGVRCKICGSEMEVIPGKFDSVITGFLKERNGKQ